MAAGLGFKTFTTGEVLTAADTNGYLMQGVLVFASAAARDAAITSPQEGQYCYLKDTNSTQYYDGAAWVSGVEGDISGVTAGVGISGGGTSGTVTVTNSMATAIDAKGDLIAGTGADAFSRLAVGANNTIIMADSAQATGLKYAGTYTDFTPTVTALTGTFTSTSVQSRYLIIGNMCHWYGKVTVTTAGTAAGAIVLTLPAAKYAGANFVGFAEETASVGFACFGLISASNMAIRKVDFSNPIANGVGIDWNITYEVA